MFGCFHTESVIRMHRSGYSNEALALAAAQAADEAEADGWAAQELPTNDEHYDEDAAMALPVCMPSPDGLLLLFDSIFGPSGSGTPVRSFAHLILRVILTLKGLMGIVLLGGAIGAWIDHPGLALPEDMQLLVTTAGDVVGLTGQRAAIAVPLIAGLAEAAAIVAFWASGPAVELCATACLLVKFALVAHVHQKAGAAVLPPAVFVCLTGLKLVTAPRPKRIRKME